VAALQQISLGICADSVDEYCRVSETTALLCLKEFSKSVVRVFGQLYLREPTQEDISRIERQFNAVGVPGCIGCLDCAGWMWKSCPKAVQGSHIGKEGKPKLRMECVCDLNLHIWNISFGYPGVLNDINILDIFPLFSKFLAGVFPPVKPKYMISDSEIGWFYYLTDGIYPRWIFFVQTVSNPTKVAQNTFAAKQQAVRKCVERVFGVLFARFHILCTPSGLWTIEAMGDIMTACATMHNMIVAVRKYEYTGDGAGGSHQESADQHGEVFSGLLEDLNIGEQNDVVQSVLCETRTRVPNLTSITLCV
jgi:Plant transposon protein